ncbi:hypothetical protein COO91_01868 [Nostoc flagelliforme CCNUN1]|uniref:Uncharacterized protein n=1 Tax=Nostoc flagelliforme CCNUN1 TaxID=2038116 RepID=A0A2K8SMC5_9NOSO|nr:hypothetical protein COO91_01868 [Nostoc flagelliforme CCNUN1]
MGVLALSVGVWELLVLSATDEFWLFPLYLAKALAKAEANVFLSVTFTS